MAEEPNGGLVDESFMEEVGSQVNPEPTDVSEIQEGFMEAEPGSPSVRVTDGQTEEQDEHVRRHEKHFPLKLP